MNEELLKQLHPDCNVERVKALCEWVVKNATLISQTASVKIELNSKGENVSGMITSFPDSK